MSDRCIACGMPMNEPGDHPMGDDGKDYCVHCARPDGTMLSYEEKLDSLTNLLVEKQGLDEDAARASVIAMMAELPAWKDRPSTMGAG